MAAKQWNPLAFNRWPVTVIVTVVYLAILIPILVIEHVLPSAPTSTLDGLDIHEAWLDLQHLTSGFHPYNAHQNDEVRSWLLTRIDEILQENRGLSAADKEAGLDQYKPDVFVFDDNVSNLTVYQSYMGVYFEGTNVMVYIRGRDDDKRNWWETPGLSPSGKGGVLVNAHYDSVSTGYGATDDGIGVISGLQLVKYFTTPGHEPSRGLVVLFNNGEEDFLNGARVYSQHPISKFAHTFLNLEGAGAGGRATLFRASDTQVARAYKKSPYPFGSVLSDTGFKTNLIRSQTDYIVFEGDLGLRGLDVAFMEPRARYHTNQDDAKHTSLQSLWHMLSAAVATTEDLVSDSSDDFEGKPQGPGKVASGSGSESVWFDLFGTTFVVFELHTLFALSVTLLIVGPLTLLITSIVLANQDRMYLFAISIPVDDGFESVPLRGWRGVFRFPFISVTATAGAVALAYLFAKVNPLIVHSSEYAVWSTVVSAWVFIAWFLSRIANFARPSALHRIYMLTWLSLVTWVLLVVATVYENRDGIAGGYFVLFYTFGTFLATWISYLELFALPKKAEFANQFGGQTSRRASSGGSRLMTPSADSMGQHEEEEEPSESTSLLRGRRTTFANYTRAENNDDGDAIHSETGREEPEVQNTNVYGYEQAWSAKLPTWTWVIQFLLTAPIVIILVGQLGLLITSATHQTGQDGSSSLTVYLLIAVSTTLLFIPTLPFLHRFTYHIPTFLFLLFVATLIYNLVAFPFSAENRVKLFFVQEVDLDTGVNQVSLTGIPPFVSDAVALIPSANGQNATCAWKTDRLRCSWEGLAPHVLLNSRSEEPPLQEWVQYKTKRLESVPNSNNRRGQVQISGLDSRGCVLNFDTPIKAFHVAGSAIDEVRYPINIPPEGTSEIRLWSRKWENNFVVDVEWKPETDADDEKLTGTATCTWSDANTPGLIPALDEIIQYSPDWVAVTKLESGLVKGSRKFTI
ncbi:putative zinc metalloprotease [Talaromyces proteolyticus]|uniref:Peptide hydrolase n=1 Tax=Talaromyces proteolyticus TaxID=1131652 RepID=A0AAD4KK04_9EURO|nr:putative zinc metalloprotease [Talaromyces proteolyticus]KAH8692788.1 putative zinc metalloprotease [Talaromyces proteolyticus]